MTKSFKFVINGKEYVVEVGDLSRSPVTVVVNGRAYTVETLGGKIAGVPVAAPSAAPRAPEPPLRPVEAPPAPSPAAPAPVAAASGNAVTAPLPCKVLSVKVKGGEQVKAKDVLLVVECMKMEINIPAPRDGVVRRVPVAPGQTVPQGAVLAEMD